MKSKYIVFVGMGIELVGIILGCLYLGQFLDNKWGSKGLAMITLMAVGLAGWLIQIVKLTKKLENDEDN